MTSTEHWRQIAERWNQMGSPLRPGSDDVRHFNELASFGAASPLRGLILGVTPELFHLAWPAGSHVVAADRSPEMIAAIWPGPANSAYHADWLDLPFADATRDVVLCDGGLHLLNYPREHGGLADSIARVLAPGGRFLLRLFALPRERERPADVWNEAGQQRIGSFHEFKLRMAMALQPDSVTGISVSRVYDTIVDLAGGEPAAIAERGGWPREQAATLDSYRGSSNVYHFLSEEESARAITRSGKLTLEDRRCGRYPLSERCPLLLFRAT